MVLLFEWKKILRTARGSPPEVYRIFKMLVNKEIPKNVYDPIYNYCYKDYSGTSFIANPSALLKLSNKYTYKEFCTYLAFASLRSYGQYKATGKITLDELHMPFDPFKHLKNNKDRLLWLEDGNLHFLFEEVIKTE